MGFADFCGDVKAKWKEGKFKTYARWLGVLWVLVSFLVTVILRWECVGGVAINIIVAVLVGFFEMPFCCTCVPICAKIADKLKFLENYLARGIFYLLLAVGQGAAAVKVCENGFQILQMVWAVWLALTALCYILAFFRGERYEAEDKTVGALGVDESKVRKSVTQAAAKSAVGMV